MPQCCYFNLPSQVGLPSPSITVVLSSQAGDSAFDPPLGLDFAAPTRAPCRASAPLHTPGAPQMTDPMPPTPRKQNGKFFATKLLSLSSRRCRCKHLSASPNFGLAKR